MWDGWGLTEKQQVVWAGGRWHDTNKDKIARMLNYAYKCIVTNTHTRSHSSFSTVPPEHWHSRTQSWFDSPSPGSRPYGPSLKRTSPGNASHVCSVFAKGNISQPPFAERLLFSFKKGLFIWFSDIGEQNGEVGKWGHRMTLVTKQPERQLSHSPWKKVLPGWHLGSGGLDVIPASNYRMLWQGFCLPVSVGAGGLPVMRC